MKPTHFLPRRLRLAALSGGAGRFARSESGGVLIIGSLALPVLLVLAVGGIELQQVWTDKHFTQDVADAAAIEGAQQLSLTKTGADQRAVAFANAQITDLAARSTVTVTATQTGAGSMKVAIDTHRMSFFANLMPPGGFYTHAEATAKAESLAPLCVLAINGVGTATGDLALTGSAKLEAPACMTHSNRNIAVAPKAALTATLAEAVGTSTGSVSPLANIGAATIPDPFTSLNLVVPTVCVDNNQNFSSGAQSLPSGAHCGDVQLSKTAVLRLAPGTHYFLGNVQLKDQSQLDGTAGVTLVFASGQKLTADPTATLNLKGAKTGPLAGFVIATARDYTSDFHLPSDSIVQITGTVYVPSATLMVDGGKVAGQTSPWTVVAAKGVSVNQSADLVINANYASSDVPVPAGVGTKLGGSRLTQ